VTLESKVYPNCYSSEDVKNQAPELSFNLGLELELWPFER